MSQKFVELEIKHCTLKHHIFYNHIDKFKYDKEEVTVIPPEHCSYDWIAQFLHQKPEEVKIKLYNKFYNKMAYSWQGTSFGMYNEHYAIVFWGKGFTKLNFDAHDVNQIELGKHKGKTRSRYF